MMFRCRECNMPLQQIRGAQYACTTDSCSVKNKTVRRYTQKHSVRSGPKEPQHTRPV